MSEPEASGNSTKVEEIPKSSVGGKKIWMGGPDIPVLAVGFHGDHIGRLHPQCILATVVLDDNSRRKGNGVTPPLSARLGSSYTGHQLDQDVHEKGELVGLSPH